MVSLPGISNNQVQGAANGFNGSALITNSPFNWLINGKATADAPSANIENQAGNMSRLSDSMARVGADQWAKYEQLYAPVERQFIRDSQTIDSQENQDKVAGEVGAGVRSAFDKAEQTKSRQLAASGINPNSGRARAFADETAMARAATEAQGMNQARDTIKQQGIAMRAGVVQQGNTVANNSMLAGQTAMQGYGGSGNLSIGGSNANTGAFNATTTAGSARTSQARGLINDILGSVSGMGGFGSSKKIKTNKRKVSDEETLDKIREIPVGKWRYKPREGDGGEHIGPYAEDVHAQFGDEAAPGGKSIDVISMHGIELSAIRGLAKQVDKLASKVDQMSKGV